LAGVEFIDENGGGPDVRLRKDRRNLVDHQYGAAIGSINPARCKCSKP